MHKARAFFFVCAGILCLALAYHFGAQSATAQSPGNPVVAIVPYGTALWAVTSNGDTYYAPHPHDVPWSRGVNVFGGSPTPASQESWGGVKARYRPEGAAKQAQDK